MEAFDYIQAAKGSRIMDRDQEDRSEMIRVAVTRAYELRGVQPPANSDLQFIINEVEKKIAAMYPHMTGQELTILTEQGVAGELTRDTKPTASAIFGWMSAYITSDARKDALRSYQRNLHWHGDQHGPDPDEVAELNRQAEVRALNTLWQEFRALGRFADDHLDGYIAMACDGLLKRNIIKVTEENWRQARELAEKDVRRTLGSSWVDRSLPYNPVFKTKRVMLAMCFRGLINANYDFQVTQ